MTADAFLPASEYAAIAASCQALVWRSAALVDSQRTQQLAEVFADEAVMVRPGQQELRGIAEIIRAYAARPSGRITRHLVTNTLVEVESRSVARSRSYVLLWAGSEDDESGPRGRPASAAQVVGEFDDVFALDTAGWRIVRREARFVLHAAQEAQQS